MSSFYPLGPALAYSYRFDVLDRGFGKIGEVTPDKSSSVTISNRTAGAVKRQLSGFRLLPADAAAVNPATDRIRPMYVPADGSLPLPLGVFMWADHVNAIRTYGNEMESTLHDLGLLLGQPALGAVSFPSESGIYDALFQVATWAGFGDVQIDYVAGSFPAPQAWPAGNQTTYYSVLSEVCSKHAGFFDPYFNNEGRLRLRDPGELSSVIAELVYDDDRFTGRVERSSVFIANNLMNAANRYVVLDTSANPASIAAIYTIPPDAPHSWEARGDYFTKYLEVQGVGSPENALLLAINAARTDAEFYEEATWTATVDPRHDTFDVVRVHDGDYLETEWNLSGATMTHKGKRIKHAEVRSPGGIIGTQPGIPGVPSTDPGTGTPPPPDTGGGTDVLVGAYEAETATRVDLAATPPTTGSGWWEIDSTGRFLAPDGQRTRLLGANGSVDVMGGGAFIFNMPVPAADGGGRETFTNRVNDVKNWGWNLLRVIVLPSVSGQTTTVNAVRDLVALCAPQKIVCEVYCLEAQSPNSSNTANASTAPFSTVVLPFFQALLAAVPAANLPYLWLNPNGENREDSSFSAWQTLNNGLYSAIRGYTGGANVMLSFTTYNFGQTLLSSTDWGTFKTGKTRVALGWHTYGGLGSAAAYETARAAARAANMAILVEEFGYYATPTAGPPAGFNPGACCGSSYGVQRPTSIQVVDDWYATKGESAVVWIGTSDENTQTAHAMRYNPTANGGYLAYSLPLSELGNKLWTVRTLAKVY